MNRNIKSLLFGFVAILMILLLVNTPVLAQYGYTLDHVDNAFGNTVQPDIPIVFHVNAYNYSGGPIVCVTTGFRVYISNNGDLAGATYSPIMYNTDVNWGERFQFIYAINSFSVDGIGADTIGIGGLNITNTDVGFEDGYDDIVFTLTTSVDAANAGDSLCIDSSYYPPAGTWLWSVHTASNTQPPDWSGPHCFEILPSCCIGITGNYDNSPDNAINVGDIEVLIGYMFRMEPAPICMEEADISGDGLVDVADLVYFINYAFFGGPQPVDCP